MFNSEILENKEQTNTLIDFIFAKKALEFMGASIQYQNNFIQIILAF
jgi:hypothetical protein